MDSDIEPSEGQEERGESFTSIRAFSRLGQTQVLVAASFLGVLTAVVGLMAWTAISNQGKLPPLAVEDFERARQRWQANAPLDYDVTIEVAGRQAAVYHVEVRAGEVVVSTRNSRPLKQRRTRGTWSVPGMFNTMQSDVDNAEQHRLGTAAAGVPQVHKFPGQDIDGMKYVSPFVTYSADTPDGCLRITEGEAS